MGKKVYAIKEGFDFDRNEKIENIMVTTWNECLKYVKGVRGAKYKSFESELKAREYLEDENKLLRKGIDKYPLDCIHAYVDGSFNEATGKYAYGLVVTNQDTIVYMEAGAASDDNARALRQISGELKAAICALEYAVKNKQKEIVIFHDYEGIYHHAVGSWERKDISSKLYFEQMNFLKKLGDIDVIFVKVDSHTGDLFNDIADEIAKKAIDLKLPRVVEAYLKNNYITVENGQIKQILEGIAGEQGKNIIVLDNKNV